jgi:hypothetical protein
MRRTAIARLADNLKDVLLLFPLLEKIVLKIVALFGLIHVLIHMMMQLWKRS